MALRIGYYCSYCEVPVKIAIHVEHKVPKSDDEKLALSWSNFLLACTICNANKGSLTYSIPGHLWPDRDNTARAFRYLAGALIMVDPGLPEDVGLAAEATNQMVRLDYVPDSDDPQADLRWAFRFVARAQAEEQLAALQRNETEELKACIVQLALATGFWSTWMDVFETRPDMRTRFLRAFPGTDRASFDAATQPVARRGGLC